MQAQVEASNLLNLRLQQHSRVLQAKTIAIYLTNDGELDTMPFIHWCWQRGITVCIPRIHPFSANHLLFMRYHQNSEMKANKFGIPEPILSCEDVIPLNDIDIIFTPLVAFDDQGARLGMGGGFYDRTLSKWHKSFCQDNDTNLWPIGIAHDCQQVESIPIEHWDIPIPEIITPSKQHKFI